MNTVQAILRKLLKRELIKLNRIVYTGTTLSRSFSSVITSEYFIILQMKEHVKELIIFSKTSLVTALFEEEGDTKKALEDIEALKTMLSDYKKSLTEEEDK